MFKPLQLSVILALLVLPAAVRTAFSQTFTKLYDFGPYAPAPFAPRGTLAQGRDGSLYGTTDEGGLGPGTVFKITPSGILTELYEFDIAHGQAPAGGVTLGTDGDLYGATTSGGSFGWGTLFKVTPTGKLTVLHNFANDEDGSAPRAPLVLAADGNFYGTTTLGGRQGYGTVFKLAPTGKLTTVHAFNFADGFGPYDALIQATDGNFYGTASYGGSSFAFGTVFRVTPHGKLTVLYTFDNTHGSWPLASLAERSDGSFYGSTSQGGANFLYGTVFQITRNGALTDIHDFGGPDGSDPADGLIRATNGSFYAVTGTGGINNYGTIYKISGNHGRFSEVYKFDGMSGADPYVTLFQHTNGNVYGHAESGGAYDKGTFYSLDIGAAPFVALVLTSGQVGQTIGILGQGFTGTADVSFNGMPSVFTVVKGTFLKAIVPAGAATGFVTVTTPSGILKSSKKFRVKP